MSTVVAGTDEPRGDDMKVTALSKRTTRGLLALITAVTMTLWLVAPAAVAQEGPPRDAPADETAEDRGDNASDQGQESRQQQGDNRSHPDDQEDGQPDEAQDRSSQARAQRADSDGDSTGDNNGKNGGENDGVANRGSVKISDGLTADEHPDNEPHVGCEFSIDYFGFDGGERDFEIWLQPPTGADVLVHSGSTSLEDTQGSELSGSQPVTFEVLNADGQLTEDNRHDQQGWHLKVIVAGADGDTDGPKKSKVFWIDCPSEEDVAGAEAEAAPDEEDVAGAEAEAAPDEEDVAVLGTNEEREHAARDAAPDQQAQVLGVQFQRPEDEVAAVNELPITGTDAAVLAGIALAMMGGGALLLTAMKRRRTTAGVVPIADERA